MFSAKSTSEPAASNAKGTSDQALNSFIKRAPNARYTFDGERGSTESEICREGNGRECIKLQMQSTKLFEAMQAQGFFCLLPMDPSRTYIECTPIPKS